MRGAPHLVRVWDEHGLLHVVRTERVLWFTLDRGGCSVSVQLAEAPAPLTVHFHEAEQAAQYADQLGAAMGVKL